MAARSARFVPPARFNGRFNLMPFGFDRIRAAFGKPSRTGSREWMPQKAWEFEQGKIECLKLRSKNRLPARD